MKWCRSFIPLWSLAALCTFPALMFPTSVAASAETTASDDQRAEILRDRIKLVTLQRNRWEHLIATQQDLVRYPDKISRVAADAAKDMTAAAREMMVEGAFDGLGNVLKLEAAYAHRVEPIARQFKQGAAGVDAAYQLFVKDRVGTKKGGEPKPEELIDKINASIGVGVESIPDPDVRNLIGAMMPLTRGAAGFASAYLRGDLKKMDETFASTKALFEGTLIMLGALSQKPEALQGAAGAIARKYPAFGATAGFMSTTALTDFNIALAVSKLSYGTYAWWIGYELDNQAEAIREDQQITAVRLQRLLPRARQEVLRAREEEDRLQAELEVIEKRLQPPVIVLPSQRFIDDGVAVPVRWTNLPLTLDAIRTLPAVSSGLTQAEMRRQQQAAREVEQRRKAEAEAARREAQRQNEYAETRHTYYREQERYDRGSGNSAQRERSYSSGNNTSSSDGRSTTSSITTDPNGCFATHCLGGSMAHFDAVNHVNKVIDGLNAQQGASHSDAGNIPHVK